MTRKWIDRPTWRLPGNFGYHANRPVKAGCDIDGAGEDRERGQDEHDPAIRQLLKRVVGVEPVGLRRQVKGGIADEDGPRIRHDPPGRRDQALPLSGREQHHHKDEAVADPEQNAQKMPVPGHSDRVAVAGQADPRRKMPGVFLGRPDAIRRHLDRRQPQPLAAGRAMDVPIQPRVVHEDLESAAHEQGHNRSTDGVDKCGAMRGNSRRSASARGIAWRADTGGRPTCPTGCTPRQTAAPQAR